MALQYSAQLRTNQASQIVATVGTGGTLRIYAGAEPANTLAAEPATTLCTINLPSGFLSTATNDGTTTLSGSWTGTGSVAAGSGTTAASFRIYDSANVCHLQGNCTQDLHLNNSSIATGQSVSITGFTVTVGNQ